MQACSLVLLLLSPYIFFFKSSSFVFAPQLLMYNIIHYLLIYLSTIFCHSETKWMYMLESKEHHHHFNMLALTAQRP